MCSKTEAKMVALLQKAENFMIDSFTDYRSKIPRVIGEGIVRHNIQCKEYARYLADKRMDVHALEIAALLHNIERAYTRNNRYPQFAGLDHSDKSAEIAAEFLKKQRAPKDLIGKVRKLVRLHEKGGTHEAQVLVEADGLSFLENTLPIWFEVGLWMGKDKEELIEESRKKIDSEWKQIKSKKGKEMAKKFYDKWFRWLEQKEEVVRQEQEY